MPTGFTFDAYRIKNERLLEEYRSPFSRLFETFLQFLVRQLRNNGFSIRSKIRLLAGEKRSEQVVHLFTRQDLSRTDSSRFCQRKCQRVTDLLMYFATGIDHTIHHIPNQRYRIKILHTGRKSIDSVAVISQVRQIKVGKTVASLAVNSTISGKRTCWEAPRCCLMFVMYWSNRIRTWARC